MGAGQYLNLVKQRAYVEAGETTDVQMTANQNAEETAESEEGTEDEITAARPLQNPDMISMLEELNRVQVALQRQEPQDATRLQHMMLQMLEDIRSGVTEEGVGAKLQHENWRSVRQLSEVATRQGRIQSGMYYGRRCAHFRGDAWESSMDFFETSSKIFLEVREKFSNMAGGIESGMLHNTEEECESFLTATLHKDDVHKSWWEV